MKPRKRKVREASFTGRISQPTGREKTERVGAILQVSEPKKTRAEAIEAALKYLDVGDNLHIHSEDGRTEYILTLIAKEENK